MNDSAAVTGRRNFLTGAGIAACAAASLSSAAGADHVRPGVLRTPDGRFAHLPEFNFKPHYHEVAGYRMHYLDEGPSGGPADLVAARRADMVLPLPQNGAGPRRGGLPLHRT